MGGRLLVLDGTPGTRPVHRFPLPGLRTAIRAAHHDQAPTYYPPDHHDTLQRCHGRFQHMVDIQGFYLTSQYNIHCNIVVVDGENLGIKIHNRYLIKVLHFYQ